MCLLTDTFTRIHLLVTETPIFRCLMCFALCGKFAKQSSHEHSVMICPSARWDWYGQVATRARWTGLAHVQGPMPRAWSQGVQTRTAGRETGETSPLRFGMWIARCIWLYIYVCMYTLPLILIYVFNYYMLYCVVFLVFRQGSGANVCMRTPWPHQLIKAHDSPPGCDKAALNGQVVPWILWRASCIRSNIWPFSGAWMPVGMEVCSRVTGTICRKCWMMCFGQREDGPSVGIPSGLGYFGILFFSLVR